MLRLKTLVMSVLFSLSASAGIYCFMVSLTMLSPWAAYPVVVALATGVQGASFVTCLGLLILYFYLRYKHDYEKGLFVDLFLVIVLLVPFYYMWHELHPVVETWTWLHDFIEAMIS